MADESALNDDTGEAGDAGGEVSLGSLYADVSLRHGQLERDASSVKAIVSGVAQQLGELGSVQVASGLASQFAQVAAAIAPAAAMATALSGALGGLAQGGAGTVSAAGGAAGQAQAAAARMRGAAEQALGALRLPGGPGLQGSGGLTAAQKNALAVEQAAGGGAGTAGRLELERDRSVDEMRNRGASAPEIAGVESRYGARIDAARAKTTATARRRAAQERAGALADRRAASAGARLTAIDDGLRGQIGEAGTRSGDPGPGAARAAQMDRAERRYRSRAEQIDRIAPNLPGGADNPGIAQARQLASQALQADQSATQAQFGKASDAQGLQQLGASLDTLKAKRDLFLAGWRENGDESRRYLGDLSALYKQVSAAATATPEQQERQAHLMEEIGAAAKTASAEARRVPAAAREAQAAIEDVFGSAVARSLWESQGGGEGGGRHGRERRRRMPFGKAMRRELESGFRQTADEGIGRLAQRGAAGLAGSALRGWSGLFSGRHGGSGLLGGAAAKVGASGGLGGSGADGSAGKPFYVRMAAASRAAGTAGLGDLAGPAAPGLPPVPAGMLGHKPLAELFGGFGSLLHFAEGGPVPDQGKGGGDTVPAMLSPGEFVLSKPMLGQMAMPAARAGGAGTGAAAAVSVTIHQHGDNHFHTEADLEEFSRRQAWSVKDQLQTSAPGIF